MKISMINFLILLLLSHYCILRRSIFSNKGSPNSLNECRTKSKPEVCNASDILTSKNEKYYAFIKKDGCFTIFESGSKKEKWSTCLQGQKINDGCQPRTIKFTKEGIAELIDCQKRVLWKTTKLEPGTSPFKFRLTNEGVMKVLDKTNKIIWPHPLLKKAVAPVELMHSPEIDHDRPGSDYHREVLPLEAVYEDCYKKCKADKRCKAYSYVRAGVYEKNPVCYLKNPAPAKTQSNCCISGQLRKDDANAEIDYDRPGSDLKHEILPLGAVYEDCYKKCKADERCKAYSYVRAGVYNKNPICYLKSPAPAKTQNKCCISGIVRE